MRLRLLNRLSLLNLVHKVFLIFSLLFVANCIPQQQAPSPGKPPRSAVNPPLQTTVLPVVTSTPPNQDLTARGCPAGSEAAISELRACCRESRWGQSCDGNCWQAGVGEKLKKMCADKSAPVKDCDQSPDKTKTTEWCAFHFNRRYCGIPDSEWLKACKSTTASPAQSPSR